MENNERKVTSIEVTSDECSAFVRGKRFAKISSYVDFKCGIWYFCGVVYARRKGTKFDICTDFSAFNFFKFMTQPLQLHNLAIDIATSILHM